MEPSVESLCNLLARSRLLPADGIRAIYQRWRGEAKDPANVAQFSKWLVAGQHVTEYQVGLLLLGHADHFFLNDYKLLDRIGKGRMAGVYKAVHASGQTVAIKVLPPSKVKDPEVFGRFQREARLALRLKHANVVGTFEVGEAGGLHYIVMEYLEGQTAEELLQRRGRLPWVEAATLVYQALLGLQHLHEQGMVHRDLKPANLMLATTPPAARSDQAAQARVKVLDIGLGRALFDETNPGTPCNIDLTSEGAILGTPEYMSPEQTRDAHQADIRADIYSLGCVLYHLLTGQPPFPDKNLVRQIVRHASETPRPLKEFNPEVPDALQEVVSGMMVKDAAHRYPTPNQAARALRVVLHSESVAVRPPEAEALVPGYAQVLEMRGQPEAAGQPPQVTAVQPGAQARPRAARATPAPPTVRIQAAQPLFTPPVSATSPGELDVELIPRVPRPDRPGKLTQTMGLSRRTWYKVAIAATATVIAATAGWFLAQLLRRQVHHDE
ncbi:MAG TPA: serine/threonine-protein kinase [Gemmataceae bacterium]|nr:serine/threonine-protein kinase [Gemmataceae bacterium]